MYRRDLTLAAGPGPVRQQMHHRQIGAPTRLIQPVAVLGKTGQIEDAGVRTARAVVRRGLAQIIEAGPDEFAGDIPMLVLRREHLVGAGAEVHRMQLVGADLVRDRVAAAPIAHRRANVWRHRKQIHTAAAQRRGGLAAENGLVREPAMERGILRLFADALGACEFRCVADAFALVVEADDIQHSGQRHLGRGVVHRHRGGVRGVFLMHDGVQCACDRRALLAGVLLTDFVTDAPQDHRRMIAVAPQHRAQVRLVPLREHQVEIQRGLLHLPTVEHLVHHQQAHAVGQL